MIGIATAVWKREDVFKAWAINVKHCFNDALVSVAYSEPHYKNIIEGYGFEAIYHDNMPLGWKFNASIKNLEGRCDNIITTGSDDIVSDALAEFYYNNLDKDYIGLLDCWFYDVRYKKTKYWSGYCTPRRIGEPIGAGKMVSARVMDSLKWSPFPAITKSLDFHYHHAVMNLDNIDVRLAYCAEIKNAFIVDLKSSTNMNKFVNLPAKDVSNGWINHTHYVDIQ